MRSARCAPVRCEAVERCAGSLYEWLVHSCHQWVKTCIGAMSRTARRSWDPAFILLTSDSRSAALSGVSLSAAAEQTRHVHANWGPRSVVLAIQTHSDGVRRCAGWQPDPGRARLSRPAAARPRPEHQTALGRVQASYPLLSQVKLTSLRPALHLSILTAMSSDAHAQGCSRPAAVLSVIQAGLDQTSTWNIGTYRWHDACAAAAHSLSCGGRRKPRSAFSAYASSWSAAALWLTARPFARECTS